MRISRIKTEPFTSNTNPVLPILVLLSLIVGNISANPDSFIGIEAFTSSVPDDSSYQSLHEALFKRLHYEVLPRGIHAVLIKESVPEGCIAVAGGTIKLENESPVLFFFLTKGNKEEEETKQIPLKNRSRDDVLDLMALKIRQFLELNISGKVRISSVPLDCEILLNGIKIGMTPAELVLEKGTYNIRLQREHLIPYQDSIHVNPGNETVMQASMRFEGYGLKNWVLGSSFFTLCTVVSWIIENNLHKNYKGLDRGVPSDIFDNHYNRYRNANYIRIGLLNTAILGWTITGFQFTRNRTLKKRIYGESR